MKERKIKFLSPYFYFRIKMLTIVALLVLLNICKVFGENIFSLKATVTVNANNVPIKDLFRQIEEKSDYVFLFDDEIERELQSVISLDAQNEEMSVILDAMFKNTNLKYLVNGRQVIVYKDVNKSPEKIILQSEKILVTGVVRDSNGETLPGVAVLIKGTTIGVLTNEDGEYFINVSSRNDILVFSYVGFAGVEIKIDDKLVHNVVMSEAIQEMEEVVVVGYGVQKKESVVGSIVRTTNEELMKSGNITDLKQALTGRLPGVTTSISTGEPGGYGDGSSATQIYIRGRNSWNNAQPLILVDGVERSMDNLDASEVESISVLKDASATAVFGVKGANGVILVTTKRGKDAKPEMSLSYNATALTISRLPNKLDSYDALRLRNEAIERDVSRSEALWNDYTPEEVLRRYRERDYPAYEWVYPNVDWTEALFKDIGWSHRVALNARGGTRFVKYFGNVSYLHEGDMFKEYNNHKGYSPSWAFDRFNFRTNFDFILTKTTMLKVNLSGFFSQKNTNYSFDTTGSGQSPMIWAAAYEMPPDVFVVQFPDGAWGASEGFPWERMQNPVAHAYNLGVWERRSVQLNTDFTFEQQLDFITKGLKFSGYFFYENNIQTMSGINDQTNQVRPDTNTKMRFVYRTDYEALNPATATLDQYSRDAPLVASSAYDWIANPWSLMAEGVSSTFVGALPITRRTMYQAQLNYARLFADKHNAGLMGLFKREEYARGSMFPTYREDWVFRATYDFESKYFFEGNGAYNGSEKFSPDYRFDFFPSLAVGWYVSNEKFFQDRNRLKWLNRVKLRYSLGWVGDDSAGSRWLYQAQYSYGDWARLNTNPQTASPYQFYNQSVVPNPDAHWEKAKKSNAGVELGFLRDMISINMDYFDEHRTDIMIGGSSRAIPPYFGDNVPAANLGEVKANGYEIELNFNDHTYFGLDYWLSAAMTHTRNEIIFRDDPALQVSYQKQAGYPIGQTRTQLAAGFYNTWDDVYASIPQQTNDINKIPGFYDIVDFNGDGMITSEDAVPWGFPVIPENTYNLSLGTSYKGVSLMLQFYGVNNVTRYVPSSNYTMDLDILHAHTYDFWSKDNSDATSFLPRWKVRDSNFIGNYYYYDGSYIRLKTAELAYTLQQRLLKSLGVSSVRVYLNGNNLWFWSRMPDDRENNDNGGSADRGAYPTTRRMNLGIDITF